MYNEHRETYLQMLLESLDLLQNVQEQGDTEAILTIMCLTSSTHRRNRHLGLDKDVYPYTPLHRILKNI